METLDQNSDESRQHRFRAKALRLGGVASAIIPVNILVASVALHQSALWALVVLLALLQAALGLAAVVYAMRYVPYSSTKGAVMAVGFSLVGLGGLVAIVSVLALTVIGSAGGAWGRPLRLRGRILHPNLRIGSDWTRGEKPQTIGLDEPTRRALEALWLHDAQKEHASVPAFARLSWILAGVGAPADLLEACHRAALEEIDHARRCFALAAGYGGRSHTAEPMPDLLLGGLDLTGDPWAAIAVESLKDGCLLEDFNADVAGLCAAECQEPVTRAVLEQITREERSHAELSWKIVELCLQRGATQAHRALQQAVERLDEVARPTAVSQDKQALVAAADAQAMRRHGRLPDTAWAAQWSACRECTAERLRRMLEVPLARAA